MDLSLTNSSDPQFTHFPPFSTSNAPNHPLFGGPGPVSPNPYNNNEFQPQPQTQPAPSQATTSFNHRPYSEMICAAIAALNEPDGSSKMAISRYIERFNTGLPPAHGALLTHHLKTLKNSGALTMVKKSYKFASSSSLPESIVVAAGPEIPRSEIPPSNTVNDKRQVDPMSVTSSASQPQKRGRGRPPKPKPEAQQQPGAVQPSEMQHSGQPMWEQNESAVAKPAEEVQESAKRGPGRPRKDGAAPIVQAAVMAGIIMKRRGRPPGRRAPGRQRKPKSVSSTASVFPYVTNGTRRRGRPRRVDSSGTVAPVGGEIVAVAPGMKRGRGRPPKIGGVISRLMKPKRGIGRPVGRPRKAMLIKGAIVRQDSGYVELKRKFDIVQEKVKEVVNLLKAGVTSDNQAVVQAIQKLEGLIEKEPVEPAQAMEEVQLEEAASPQGEAETQREEQGQERGGEAEAMHEALF